MSVLAVSSHSHSDRIDRIDRIDSENRNRSRIFRTTFLVLPFEIWTVRERNVDQGGGSIRRARKSAGLRPGSSRRSGTCLTFSLLGTCLHRSGPGRSRVTELSRAGARRLGDVDPGFLARSCGGGKQPVCQAVGVSVSPVNLSFSKHTDREVPPYASVCSCTLHDPIGRSDSGMMERRGVGSPRDASDRPRRSTSEIGREDVLSSDAPCQKLVERVVFPQPARRDRGFRRSIIRLPIQRYARLCGFVARQDAVYRRPTRAQWGF